MMLIDLRNIENTKQQSNVQMKCDYQMFKWNVIIERSNEVCYIVIIQKYNVVLEHLKLFIIFCIFWK